MDFLEYSLDLRIKKNNIIIQLNELIDWNQLKKPLKKVKLNDENQGRPCYNVLSMFKAILLGQWHSLSDKELEEALSIRLDFIRFTGFGINEEVPDETTLCRFRNRLIKQNLLERLLKAVNKQLEAKNLKVNKSQGAIVDATIIESASKPDKIIEASTENEVPKVEYAKDFDSRWLKKGSKSYFGYRGYLRCEAEDGYIEKIKVYPANEYEAHKLEELVEDLPKLTRVYADKGFASKENRQMLNRRKLKDGLMHKAKKLQPLRAFEKIKNKLISKVRYKIEQCFGTLKRRFKLNRSTYLGCKNLEGQLYLKGICMNLLKAYNKAFA